MSRADPVEVLHDILYRADPRHSLYVYRVGKDDRVQRPYLYKCEPWPGLLETLRDQYGGGHFRILVRCGRVMVLRTQIAVVTASSATGLVSCHDK